MSRKDVSPSRSGLECCGSLCFLALFYHYLFICLSCCHLCHVMSRSRQECHRHLICYSFFYCLFILCKNLVTISIHVSTTIDLLYLRIFLPSLCHVKSRFGQKYYLLLIYLSLFIYFLSESCYHFHLSIHYNSFTLIKNVVSRNITIWTEIPLIMDLFSIIYLFPVRIVLPFLFYLSVTIHLLHLRV